MNTHESNLKINTIILYGLAVVGFITLVGSSIWLASYSARFIPIITKNIASASVYLGSTFSSRNVTSPKSTSSITSNASTTILFGHTGTNATSTSSVSKKRPTTQGRHSDIPSAGKKISHTYKLNGTHVVLSGLPDLMLKITSVGYLNATSTNSFIASSTVPIGKLPAIKFTVKNIGTNISGEWRFSAYIPTRPFYLYKSSKQRTLRPNESIDYTLGFNQASQGLDKVISIKVNFDNTVAESITTNDTASTSITILGSPI